MDRINRVRQLLLVSVLLTGLVLPALPRAAAQTLTAQAANSAIDEFKAALDERWSYRYANQANFDAAIAALRRHLDSAISKDELGLELQKILALGIDGHSRVSGYRFSGGFLPFLIEEAGSNLVAITPDRRSFLADGFPFLIRIDGKNVAEWSAMAATLVPRGSPQYVHTRSLGLLRQIDYWRKQLRLPVKDTVDVELLDVKGRSRKTVTLPIAKASPAYGVWPAADSQLLDNNIGYLRLKTMEESPSVAEIKEWMPKFRSTSGLIVDVRDNDGGDRAALIMLYSYLASPGDKPRVFTAAAYRLHPSRKDDYLAQEHRMFRAGAKEWTGPERKEVGEFARSFKPRWKLPEGQFSDWHYMALSRLDDPAIYHYEKPVVVLLNSKSFSATDIFLAGLKGMKNVRLLGTPSAGGSAFSQEVSLAETGLRLRLGSMVSFQADGKLFDGNGITPDILIVPIPEYFIGGKDNALLAALNWIKSKKAIP